jgi:hypothetical protein
MTDLSWQILGLLLLIATTAAALALTRGRAPLWPALTLAATMGGGFWGAFAWWPDFPGGFAWDLPPLVARMMATAGWAFALVCGLILRDPTPARLRFALWLLLAYLVPLALAILALHLDRFDFDQPLAWGFFIIVTGLILLAGAGLRRLPRPAPGQPEPAGRLMLIGLPCLLIGGYLFLIPQGGPDWGPLASFILWPDDALTTRLVAAMPLTVAAGALLASRDRALTPLTLCFTALYAVGVVVAGLWNLTAGRPLPLPYLAFWASMAGACLFLWTGRRRT